MTINGYPRKYVSTVGFKDVRSLANGECLYFDEENETWDKVVDVQSLQKIWSKDVALWVSAKETGSHIYLEYWRRDTALDRYRYRHGQSFSEWREGNGGRYHVQRLSVGRGELVYGFAGEQKSYFLDAIASIDLALERRLLKSCYDIGIEVGGRRHVIADGVAHRTADAIVNILSEYRTEIVGANLA